MTSTRIRIEDLCDQARQKSFNAYNKYGSNQEIFGSDSIQIIEELLQNVIPLLEEIKNTSQVEYFNCSQYVVKSCLIEVEKFFEVLIILEQRYGVSSFKGFYPHMWLQILKIGDLPMNDDFRFDYYFNLKEKYRNSIVAKGVNISESINEMSNLIEKNQFGCYVATMAYGDYDHPQVLKLRKFRDEVLDNSTFGQWFVKIYYHYSPKLVEKLKNQRTVNVLIRKALDQFIKLIK
jgi:hypothetical protein